MEEVSPFAVHFARLVWLIAHKPAEHDALKEQLRRSLVQLSAQPQAILLRDISLAVAGKQEDGDETISSLRELAIRMAGHSVRLLEFDAVVPVREVFEIASALASEPVHGDEGATFDEKMVSLFLTGVTAHLGTSGFVRQATPGSVRSVASAMRTPLSLSTVPAKPGAPHARTERAEAVARAAQDSQALMQFQLMKVAGAGPRRRR